MLYCFDAHSHLQNFILPGKVENIIDSAEMNGLKKIIVNSTSVDDWEKVLDLADKNKIVIPFLGIHPWFADYNYRSDIVLLADYIKKRRCGVGEIGIDLSDRNAQQELQVEVFSSQIDIALRYERPVSIHAVRADALVQSLLEELLGRRSRIPFMLHSFCGSAEMARRYISLGGYVSLSPAVLSKGREKLFKLVDAIPLESLLLESDSPDRKLQRCIMDSFFSSHNEAGFTNSPLLLPGFYRIVAEIKGVDILEFTRIIARNITDFCGDLY